MLNGGTFLLPVMVAAGPGDAAVNRIAGRLH